MAPLRQLIWPDAHENQHPSYCGVRCVPRLTFDWMSFPAVALNANRHVTGVLRGFDQFMNIVLDNAVDEKNKTDIGMVVRLLA